MLKPFRRIFRAGTEQQGAAGLNLNQPTNNQLMNHDPVQS